MSGRQRRSYRRSSRSARGRYPRSFDRSRALTATTSILTDPHGARSRSRLASSRRTTPPPTVPSPGQCHPSMHPPCPLPSTRRSRLAEPFAALVERVSARPSAYRDARSHSRATAARSPSPIPNGNVPSASKPRDAQAPAERLARVLSSPPPPRSCTARPASTDLSTTIGKDTSANTNVATANAAARKIAEYDHRPALGSSRIAAT